MDTRTTAELIELYGAVKRLNDGVDARVEAMTNVLDKLTGAYLALEKRVARLEQRLSFVHGDDGE